MRYQYTTPTLEWPKSTILTALNASRDVEQQELSFIAGRMQNGAATLEDGSSVSYKTSYPHTIESSNCALRY